MPNIRQLSTDSNGNPILIYPQELGPAIVEPLNGPLTVDDVFDRFPDTVYNQNRDTHLYHLLTALAGDSGAGMLVKQSYMSRLKTEGNLLTFTDLDTLYSHTLKFPRLTDEIYDLDPTTDVLTPLEWDDIHLKDEKYNARVRLFLTAIRLGCTPDGMATAAEAGTGIQCDVWENYKAFYDTLSDDPLGLQFQGLTNSPYEFVVTPRVGDGDPLTYSVTSQTTTQLTNVPTYSGAPWLPSTAYAVGAIVYPNSPSVRGHVYQVTTGGTSGVTEPTWNPQFIQIDPFDPNADNPTNVQTADVQTASGVVYTEIGAINDAATATGNDATYLLPEYERNMVAVLDLLRPWGTLMTVAPTDIHFRPITEDDGTTAVPWTASGSSTRFRMTRWVTGAQTVTWPIADDTTGDRSNGFFIESGVEKEASTLPWAAKETPTIYHTIEGVHAYTDGALLDATYDTAAFYDNVQNYNRYRSEHLGPFNATFAALYPIFQTIPKDDLLDATKAISLQSTPLIFTGEEQVTTDFLVNGLYPLEYFTVTGVDQVKYPQAYFWSSKNRFAGVDPNHTSSYKSVDTGGIRTSEYLELDLGRVREISYMNLSIARGPVDITVQYDALSATDGSHRWVAVTPIPNEPFDAALYYDANTKSAFHDAEFYFTDDLGKLINTRYIRIEFARRDVEWPHANAAPFQWPIVVKSLRTARFIDSYHDSLGVVFDAGISPDDDAHKILFGITQAQADDPGFTSGTDFVCQQFGLPSDYMRGDISPNIIGFSALVYVEPGGDTGPNKDVASVAWELYSAPASTRVFTKLDSGLKTGLPIQRQVWLDMFVAGDDPLATDFVNAPTIYELRLKTLTSRVDGTIVLQKIIIGDNNVPGFVLPGTSTWINAGINPAGPASNSNKVVFTQDVHTFLQPGDTIQRYDRQGGITAVVQSVSGATVTLTAPYQGATAGGVIGMRVLGMRNGVAAAEDLADSICMRLYSDVADTGRDVLGNFYRYATRRDEPAEVKDPTEPGWYCEPQPDTNAVEALYLDTRWVDGDGVMHPSVIDAIRMTPRTPGVIMHIYYCDEHLNSSKPRARAVWDNLMWTPIQATYNLTGRITITLPTTIRANYVKLEFTKLQPQPYDLPPRPGHTAVRFRRYPTWIENQFENSQVKRTVRDWFTQAAAKGLVKLDVLKTMTSPIQEFQYKEREFLAALATNRQFDKSQINSGLIDTKTNSFIDPTTGSQISVSTTAMYQSPLQLTVDKDSLLGQAVAAQQSPNLRTAVREGGFNVSRATAPFVSTSKNRVAESFSHIAKTAMWFNRKCRHVYKIDQAKFNKKAYFVGIQSLELLRKDNTVARDEDLVVENLWDDQMLTTNTWLRDNPSQLASLLTTQDSVNVLITYTVDETTYTDEPQVFSVNSDGTYNDAVLVNAGEVQAIGLQVWIQADDGSRGPIQFYLGRDYTQNHTEDTFGNLTNSLSVDVASNRLVVEHVSTNIDSAIVTGRAVISAAEVFTP